MNHWAGHANDQRQCERYIRELMRWLIVGLTLVVVLGVCAAGVWLWVVDTGTF